MATVSNPGTQWLGLRGKNALIFCLLFYQEKSEGGLGANPKEQYFLF
jgi:hypothetical protein